MGIFAKEVSSTREKELDKVKELIKSTEVDELVEQIFGKFKLFGDVLKFLGENELIEKIFKVI